MTPRVACARTEPHYGEATPPYSPGDDYPELRALLAGAGEARATNPAYAGVRAALVGLGLDEARFDQADWNPLGDLVQRGGSVVLKPNFIRHWNPAEGQSVESVITHGAVLRAVADYAFLAVGRGGSVTLAEAPQMDCDFDEIRRLAGLDALVALYRDRLDLELRVIDLRREAVRFEDGIIVERRPLPGDPLGYRKVDLGKRSFFADSGLDPKRMRGADYDPGPTGEHHSEGRHEYLLSESVLRADLVVNLPKLKTHKKTGVTLALKNLVGINGDKNWLPHHCVGAAQAGGDEFPDHKWADRLRSRATEIARPLLQRGRGLGFFRLARRLESAARGDDFIRAGNWYGNQTTWRMCLDLNLCFYYSDARGPRFDELLPPRRALTVLDGIVAGENAGPLAPTALPLGAVLAGTDPLAVDLVALALMGFDPASVPKVREALRGRAMPLTCLGSAEEVDLRVVSADEFEVCRRELGELACARPFQPHPGWRGQIERKTS